MRFVRFIFSFYFTFINLKKNVASHEVTNVTLYTCYGTADIKADILKVPAETISDPDHSPSNSYKFRLSQQQEILNCGRMGSFNYTVLLNHTRDDEFGSGFGPKGILTVKMKSRNLYRYPKDYCVLSISNDEVLLSVCNGTCDNEDVHSNRLCINKCCPINEILEYDDIGMTCGTPINELDFSKPLPLLLKNVYQPKDSKPLELSIFYENWSETNKCANAELNHIIKKHTDFKGDYHEELNTYGFRFSLNGKLSICGETSRGWLDVEDEFCMDLIQNFSNNETSSGDLVTLSAIRCLAPPDRNDSNGDYDDMNWAQIIIIYRICIPIASVFLLNVIIVYILLWDSQNVHGFTTLSYVCSLFLLYVSLIISMAITEKDTVYCKVAGIALHFLFLSTFCWLTAISFDIWWKFRHIKASSQSKQIGKYLIYCALSLTVPIIVITIGLLIDERSKCPLSDFDVKLIAPNYGNKRVCAVDDVAQGWYIYFPIGILLGCNAMFFGMTVYAMHNHKKSTNCVLEGHCTKEDNPLWLFSKLFIVMGFAWILEFVGWAKDSSQDGSFSWVTLIFDVVNLLQAVAIFYVFVCKKRIFVNLWQEHLWLRCILVLFVKTGCYEMPPDKTKPFANASSDRGITDNNGIPLRKTSNQSTTTLTSKLSTSSSLMDAI